MFKPLFVLSLAVVITGCSHTYQPRPDTFRIDPFKEFSAPVDISLENVQTDSTDHVHLVNTGHSFAGNKKAWTDTAIAIAKRELSKRQANLTDDADRKLEFSITSIEGEAGFALIRYITRLKVTTGNGYEGVYIGDNRSPATVYRAADGAVMRAVAAMFRDPMIVKYIESGQ